jgi:hypothetical protein
MILSDAASDAIAGSLMTFGCIYLGIFGFFIAMFWSIFSKAGFSGARAFLLLIPIVNLIIMIMFAFGEWPVRRELEMLRMQVQMQRNQGPQIQQISLNAAGPQMMPPQPYQQPYPPATPYQQPYQQPSQPYQPPTYPQSQYPQ